MTTKQPSSAMTKFRLFWEAADAVLARRGKPPLTYFQARDWFDCEIDPELLGELVPKPSDAPDDEARQ
jgi:hypothetical protein